MNQSRQRLQGLHERLETQYWADTPIEDLMHQLSSGYDELLLSLFHEHFTDTPGIALFAVGGYGRREVHPGSDIDLLVLADKPKKHQRAIELFLQAVFDLNVEVGHAVRDVKSCRVQARADLTVATALFERRFLGGDQSLVEPLTRALNPRRVWPPKKFFKAKLEEQQARHAQYDHMEYNLEPNVKTSPGGLRDVQTAMWICLRQFGTTDPLELVTLGVLTEIEAKWLTEGRRFICWVRFGLHLIAARKEDQLQFTYQRELAQRLGFVDTDAQSGVERFMHHYYRHVLALTEVNDILIQYFNEVVLAPRRKKMEPINEHFQLINGYLGVMDDQVFQRAPSALLEMFVIMARREDIAGVRVATIRLARDSLDLIDDEFRRNPTHTKLFLDLLKAPYTLVTQLTRMRRYGILGRYIPEFGRIIGQMQHDMFHIYTVDAHTMKVIQNMRKFQFEQAREDYPVAYHCAHTLPKIELLYIAGLYHDIGKGRGGDHSTLGAVDAEEFCQRHGLNEADTDLVCWLVRKHLYMSAVAQRQDIYDPDVVHEFASQIKSQMRLDYLYTLTVADINATNPTLWNSWRATLLRQLYTETRRTLRRGLESPADRDATIRAYQEQALARLAEQHPDIDEAAYRALWSDLGEEFFLRNTGPQIAALSHQLLSHDLASGPYIAIHNTQGDLAGEGATRIHIYTADQPNLFAATVVELSRFELDVVDALVTTRESGVCFDTYTVLDGDGQALPEDKALHQRIADRLRSTLGNSIHRIERPQRRLPRQLRELPRPTEVAITPSPDGSESILTILAADRPGLLATIAIMLVELNLQLLSAKITTLGERVEDTFIIQSEDGAAIPDGEPTYMLENTMRQHLNRELGMQNVEQTLT